MYFNHQKMHRLLQNARDARLSQRDLGERLQDSRRAVAKRESTLLTYYHEKRVAVPDEARQLAALPPVDAVAVPRDQLEAWRINPENFLQLARHRQDVNRLQALYDECAARSAALNAPISGLAEWLRGHGQYDFSRDYT